MPDPQQIIAQARRFWRNADAAAEAVRTLDPPTTTGPAHAGLEGFAGPARAFDVTGPARTTPPADPIARAVADVRAQQLADGVQAMKKLDLGREADLSPAEQTGLEAIVVLTGRPALLIQDGDFLAPPSPWSALTTARKKIKAVISRVGRIEVEGNPNFDWLGTGFLAGEATVLTNRHVAIEFAASATPGKWTFRAPMRAGVDFKAELGLTDTLEFAVTRIVGIHDTLDLAVLAVAPTSGRRTLPAPLPVASSAPGKGKVVGRQVYVIGYPAWDGRRNDPEPMRRIFSEVYNVKRLQPGEIAGEAIESFDLFHDCSTLGGNSGSPVIDLDTHQVLGLHFGGRYLEKNHAIPLWTLRQDPLIKKAKLNFV